MLTLIDRIEHSEKHKIKVQDKRFMHIKTIMRKGYNSENLIVMKKKS